MYPIDADATGNVIVVESVPASVREFDMVSVLPSAIVNVDPVAGAVIVTLLTVPVNVVLPVTARFVLIVARPVCARRPEVVGFDVDAFVAINAFVFASAARSVAFV
jgi:hypothetical protein